MTLKSYNPLFFSECRCFISSKLKMNLEPLCLNKGNSFSRFSCQLYIFYLSLPGSICPHIWWCRRTHTKHSCADNLSLVVFYTVLTKSHKTQNRNKDNTEQWPERKSLFRASSRSLSTLLSWNCLSFSIFRKSWLATTLSITTIRLVSWIEINIWVYKSVFVTKIDL